MELTRLDLLDTIHSKVDKTVKYVIRLDDGLIAEVAYIDKDDGRDIICVGCQTACDCGCKFCHTAEALGKVKNRCLGASEIEGLVMFVRNRHRHDDRFVLVSYMGCGEPMKNMEAVFNSMWALRVFIGKDTRFAVATLLPESHWHKFFKFTGRVKTEKMPVKVHLSLHFTSDEIRKRWMPCALPINPAMTALSFYRQMTENPVELHYALIDGVNDSESDSSALTDLALRHNAPVKILRYNPRDIQHVPSNRVNEFLHEMRVRQAEVEYYEPPGIDVGASCGQFLLDYYYRYNAEEQGNG